MSKSGGSMTQNACCVITTQLGTFDTEKFRALVQLRAAAMQAFREHLQAGGFMEVTTSSLVNISGSCENPDASFSLPYYGREAHLSQSAQLQLETVVGRLGERVFTINSSFREEHFEDPEADGRRLSEFTLIEVETPYDTATPDDEALKTLEDLIEETIKRCTESLLSSSVDQIERLGGDPAYLARVVESSFGRLDYGRALDIANAARSGERLPYGTDLGITEERAVLDYHDNTPVLVARYPSELKFFNIKRNADGTDCYSVDVLAPVLGEVVGGALRVTCGETVLAQLEASRIGAFLRCHGASPAEQFREYLQLFSESAMPPRMGFGVGFERFIAFLIGSNDILHTVAHRTLAP